jgi:glycosyltransferase involved in cell wall biosynthesis
MGRKSNRRISILILVTQLELAGAQKVAILQARYFHQLGFRVILTFFYDKYGLLEEIRRQAPYRVICLGAKVPGQSRISNGCRLIGALWKLYWLLSRESIDVIETLTHYSNQLGIVIAWLARVPVRISSQRGATIRRFPRWFISWDGWLANSRLVHKMVTVSEETTRFCIEDEGIDPRKLVVIRNGVNLEEFDRSQWLAQDLDNLRFGMGITSNAKVVITVARLDSIKGHRYLIQAASQIIKSCPGVIFLLVGEGEERIGSELLIDSAGVSSYFRMVGQRSDVPKLLAIADVFVLPSLSEGMPNAILEAMAARLPVVASDVGGVRELVVTDNTGLIVSPAAPDELATAIVSLLMDESLRGEMGQRGYERVKAHFSEHRMCQQYESLIRAQLWERCSRS